MATKNNLIIADTSALVSLINPTDSNHERAVEEATRLRSADAIIVLGSDVFSETINLLGKKFGHQVATDAANLLLRQDSQFLFVETTREQVLKAVKFFSKQKESVSFTDCIVLALANEHHTFDIFGFDKQFEDAGFIRLKPAEKQSA